jgi:hypothetical protein
MAPVLYHGIDELKMFWVKLTMILMIQEPRKIMISPVATFWDEHDVLLVNLRGRLETAMTSR